MTNPDRPGQLKQPLIPLGMEVVEGSSMSVSIGFNTVPHSGFAGSWLRSITPAANRYSILEGKISRLSDKLPSGSQHIQSALLGFCDCGWFHRSIILCSSSTPCRQCETTPHPVRDRSSGVWSEVRIYLAEREACPQLHSEAEIMAANACP